MSVTSTLYPPIVADTQPAFLRTGTCRVYFSLSSFNSRSEIKHAQVTLINQKTNQNAFKPTIWKLGIKFIPNNKIYEDTNNSSNYKYYIQLNENSLNREIINNYFDLNRFYKVQIRFSDIEISENFNPDANWINDSTNYSRFSEWSKVSLIRGIDQPFISINSLGSNDPSDPSHEDTYSLDIPPSIFVGRMYYKNLGEEETLKSYNIKINQGVKTIIQTGQNYTDQYHPNKLYYQLSQDLQKDIVYTLIINYTTINLYKNQAIFDFKIKGTAENELHATMEVTPQQQWGRMKINISFKDLFNTDKNLIIKRTSSKVDFLKWDDIKILAHNRDFQHLWYDTTIESGIWYKYRVAELAENPRISNAGQPIMCVFDDIFLTDKERQLKVQFNPSVSDFRYNVNESQQVTLGSQYPYIKRSGNNYYRTFSIGGLISALSDQQGWYDPNYNEEHGYFYHKNSMETFTTPEELYGDAATALYAAYNYENNITQYQDYIYEKQFRQKVLDFLYKNNVKLFRSLTEGNILIKLTNISLSPIDTLGRMLYSFSASATEIDNNSLQACNKYDIINKFYYTYNKLFIQDTFENEKSLIDRFYQEFPSLSREDIDIMQLTFGYNGPKDIIIYAKPKNNKELFRYVLQNGHLVLNYSDADPVAECYFYGIHIDEDDYIETDQHYYSTDDVKNPINLGVYYIVEQYVYRIDHYVQYYGEGGILDEYHNTLATYPEEVVDNRPNDKALLVEPSYYKMIYYDGNWYPFSKYHDIIIDQLSATIEYLYRRKMEG